jgi:hypothetical protein
MSAAAAIDGTAAGPDPDAGKLFDVPRVKVVTDLTDPTVLKIAFSGTVELDRSNAQQVEFFNGLKAGRSAELIVGVHVAGARQIHRRDSEGDVDAVVQTKGLIVTDVHLEQLERGD